MTVPSIVNLGDLTKPVDTLIEKVSSAVGILFEPKQIVRRAKAEAKAAIIKTENEIDIADIKNRAMIRFCEEEVKKQKNMEDVMKKTLTYLDADANPDNIEDDWIVNFFDKARIISDSQMQDLWAHVLAGEANAPGTYSKRTVNFLSDLEKLDAELFAKLCNFIWTYEDQKAPLIFNVKEDIYKENGINYDSLLHLESIGLIKFSLAKGSTFVETGFPSNVCAYYQGRELSIPMHPMQNTKLPLGVVLLTKVGNELSQVCSQETIPGYFEYVEKYIETYIAGTSS